MLSESRARAVGHLRTCQLAHWSEVEFGESGTENGLPEGAYRAWEADGNRRAVDADARSGRLPDVAMMQATDFGNLHDRADLIRAEGSTAWLPDGILAKDRRISAPLSFA